MENGECSQWANLLNFRVATLTDNVPVLIIFLLVGNLYSGIIPTLTATQTRYLPALFLVWGGVCEWNLINPHYPMHTNTSVLGRSVMAFGLHI